MIDTFLKKYGLTRYKVSKISGVPESTLRNANNAPINSLSVKVLQSLSMVTGLTPGQVLDEIIKQDGNSIINFMQDHPGLDKKLVNDIQDLMIDLKKLNANLTTVTFNRYYDEVEDNNDNATKAMINLRDQLAEFKHQIENGEWENLKVTMNPSDPDSEI